MKPRKRDLATIKECLDLGITLEMVNQRGQTRRFTAGQITDQIERNSVRTTHLRSDCNAYVWLPGETIAILADRARAKLARKDEILAEQKRAHNVAMGRD